MTDVSFHQLLMLYIWFPLAALLALLVLIARLYQKDFNKRTFFALYLIPIVLFGAYSVRAASVDVAHGDGLSNLLAGTAGLVLLVLAGILYRHMLHGEERP